MIATLKKEYEPFRGKTINARARQLMNILDKFKEADLKNWQKQIYHLCQVVQNQNLQLEKWDIK